MSPHGVPLQCPSQETGSVEPKKVPLDGDLTRSKLPALKKELEKLSGLQGIVLDMTNLKSVDDTGWNYLLFTKQQRGASFSLQLSGLNSEISQSLKDAELDEEFQVI